jgi:hypothetical protein
VHIAEVLHAAARRRGIRTPATEVVHIAEDLHAAARRRGRDRAVSRA